MRTEQITFAHLQVEDYGTPRRNAPTHISLAFGLFDDQVVAGYTLTSRHDNFCKATGRELAEQRLRAYLNNPEEDEFIYVFDTDALWGKSPGKNAAFRLGLHADSPYIAKLQEALQGISFKDVETSVVRQMVKHWVAQDFIRN